MVKTSETAPLKFADHCPQTNGSFIERCSGLLKPALSQFRAALPISDASLDGGRVFSPPLATPLLSPSHSLGCCPRPLKQSSSPLFKTAQLWCQKALHLAAVIREKVGLNFRSRNSNAFLSGKLFRLSPPTGAHILVLRCVHIDSESLPHFISLTGLSAAIGSRPFEERRLAPGAAGTGRPVRSLRLAPFFRE